uniref:Uncharacterized protein n=1 Tax=Arundo donax TaxID=35708 RepID=A0A0A8ZG16_ARUDO
MERRAFQFNQYGFTVHHGITSRSSPSAAAGRSTAAQCRLSARRSR